MSKFIDKPVKVQISQDNNPLYFLHSGRWIPVSRTLELWKDTGIWWNGEAEKTFHRVASNDGSIYELYQDSVNRAWFLYRIYD